MKLSNWVSLESLEMHARRKAVVEVLVDACRCLIWSVWWRLRLLYGLLMSSWGLKSLQHIEGWAVCFPCVVFMYWNIVVKTTGWGVMNVFKDLPLKEAFFQPLVVTTHFPVLVFASLIVSYPQRPLVWTCQQTCQDNEIKYRGILVRAWLSTGVFTLRCWWVLPKV